MKIRTAILSVPPLVFLVLFVQQGSRTAGALLIAYTLLLTYYLSKHETDDERGRSNEYVDLDSHLGS